MRATPDELKAFAAKHAAKLEPPAPNVLDLRTLPKRHVCVALLSIDAKMFCRSAVSLLQAAVRCGDLGWGFTYILRESDSMVGRGRSQLASRFFIEEGTKDCTDLVFVDTDVYWDADEFMRLMSHEVDVVAGAYPFKNESGNFPLRWPSQGLLEQNGLWIVQAATPGFLRIRRQALARMVTEMPWLEYTDAHGDAAHRCWMFFDNLHRANGIYDEGYVFCERWRGVGGTVYVDPKIHLKHIGLKVYDHGTLEQWNQRKTAEVQNLNLKYPNVDVMTLFNKSQGFKIDLEQKQAEALKAGAEPVILPGVKYPNRRLEGDDAQDEAKPASSETPKPPPPKGSNGAHVGA